MKVLCCGDRNWNNINIIMEHLMKFPADTIIIEGEARGADTISRMAAEFLGFKVQKFPADWEKYKSLAINGRKNPAGPIRNRQMLDEKPDLVLAFHNDIGNSKGTKDCITEAKKRGIEVRLIKEEENDKTIKK